MLLTIHIDVHTEKILRREAEARGRSMEELAKSAVEETANRINLDRPIHEREKR